MSGQYCFSASALESAELIIGVGMDYYENLTRRNSSRTLSCLLGRIRGCHIGEDDWD